MSYGNNTILDQYYKSNFYCRTTVSSCQIQAGVKCTTSSGHVYVTMLRLNLMSWIWKHLNKIYNRMWKRNWGGERDFKQESDKPEMETRNKTLKNTSRTLRYALRKWGQGQCFIAHNGRVRTRNENEVCTSSNYQRSEERASLK